MKLKNGKKIVKEIDKRMKGVAAERDKLDNLIADLSDLREDCDEAWDHLQHARDVLSELV